jgi:hypothetical protein
MNRKLRPGKECRCLPRYLVQDPDTELNRTPHKNIIPKIYTPRGAKKDLGMGGVFKNAVSLVQNTARQGGGTPTPYIGGWGVAQ